VTEQKSAATGAAAYTPLLLKLYDAAVVYASNTLLWRCSRHVQLANYQANLGKRHLDIGPGTGWYIDHANTTLESLTLLDLNPNSLNAASSTLARYAPVRVTGNILEPLPSSLRDLDSVGANFLFHCVPGDWEAKGTAFGEIAKVLGRVERSSGPRSSAPVRKRAWAPAVPCGCTSAWGYSTTRRTR